MAVELAVDIMKDHHGPITAAVMRALFDRGPMSLNQLLSLVSHQFICGSFGISNDLVDELY